ncbi:hypothetical protein Tco_1374313, partial [Tanacetum coccineum]
GEKNENEEDEKKKDIKLKGRRRSRRRRRNTRNVYYNVLTGSGLENDTVTGLPPDTVEYGYHSLNKAIEDIEAAKHVPVDDKLNPVVNKLVVPLTTITVMVC